MAAILETSPSSLNENTLEIQGGRIIVQSCDSTYANVGMVLGDKITWRKVALPSLTREWTPFYHADLDMSVFDSTLSANKESFLQLVDKLNSNEWIKAHGARH